MWRKPKRSGWVSAGILRVDYIRRVFAFEEMFWGNYGWILGCRWFGGPWETLVAGKSGIQGSLHCGGKVRRRQSR